MQYREFAPAVALRESIRCYWLLRDDPAPVAAPASAGGGSADGDPAFPDGSPELILNLGDPFVAIAADGSEREQPRIFLVGQITGPFRVRPSGTVDLVGVRLEASGATWLRQDPVAIRDHFVDLGAALGGALDRLWSELARLAPDEARVRALDDHVGPLVADGPAADWRVVDAVREIRASHGLLDLSELARRLRTTPRTLQRLFNEQVGVTPKFLARIVRFQQVFSAWREEPARLSRVAAACGYFDHAHLVKDFRELAGLPPARFLPNLPEFTRFFTS